ncbi:Protein SPIRAL1-like 1 [Zostera marina]|uniref:Protein SPIRAL1-like 1 n=1 Tax=Zostera marina TaxID=29655 RepID=A0A0K9PHR3_ZOSMR|nr:Protein SPIRAL1-like 1 [Zostera marina]
MGRGVSSGCGQSSLGYLFGSGEEPKTIIKSAPASSEPAAVMAMPIQKSVPSSEVNTKQIPAGIPGNHANNYFRADGQNSGNFITDRPSTKVHSAPGGGSSLGYLFGGN